MLAGNPVHNPSNATWRSPRRAAWRRGAASNDAEHRPGRAGANDQTGARAAACTRRAQASRPEHGRNARARQPFFAAAAFSIDLVMYHCCAIE